MIGFFPEIYPDELLYSQLCRYYQRSGYTGYIYAADDIFLRRTVHPSIEFVNEYTPDAIAHITKDMDFETVVRLHTMFPAYTRFLPKKRRDDALRALVRCEGIYHNLVVNQSVKQPRFLRYCPLCAVEDRDRFGETYWHREHQVPGIDVCPMHRCYLKDSTVRIGGKVSPGLFPAENTVPSEEGGTIQECRDERLLAFAGYMLEVFRAPVDMDADIPASTLLHSFLKGKYLSESGMKVDSRKLYDDYTNFIKDICEPMTFSYFTKVYNNGALDHHKICQLAFFQGIPVEKLVNPADTSIRSAMEELYYELSEEYHVPYDVMCVIGETILEKNRNLGKVARKSGPKQREWAELDDKYLPRVKEIVDRIYNEGGKPGHVSVGRVEREFGAPAKQFKKLPRCTEYILEHTETQNEYRARQVTWAVHLFESEGQYMSKNKLNHFLNFRKNDLMACAGLIIDENVKTVVDDLLKSASNES